MRTGDDDNDPGDIIDEFLLSNQLADDANLIFFFFISRSFTFFHFSCHVHFLRFLSILSIWYRSTILMTHTPFFMNLLSDFQPKQICLKTDLFEVFIKGKT